MNLLPFAFRVFPLVLVLLLATGCARLGFGTAEAPAPHAEPEATEIGEVERDDRHVEAPNAGLLDEAEEHFRAGRYHQAEFLFSRYLDGAESDGPPPAREEALWGLAMLHLLPDSPVVDRERAMASLEQLRDEHGESIRGAQARWVLGILDELQTVRTQMDQQSELLRQLTETVEQLRRIDLNRRPTGGRGDTIPSPTRQR